VRVDSRFCAVVNTHASYHDVLAVFLKCYFHYVSGIKLFIFSNEKFEEFELRDAEFIKYSAGNFRDQYLDCLHQIPYEFVLTFNDDYFLTSARKYSEISYCADILSQSDYSHIRFVRGSNFSPNPKFHHLYPLDNKEPYFFSQTLSIWKRSALLDVFNAVAPSGIARKKREPQFEVLANSACEKLGLSGLIYYENEKKVGTAHYECNIFPHIVSAIVDGSWNTKEYSKELGKIEKDLGLKLNPRRYPSIIKKFIKHLIS